MSTNLNTLYVPQDAEILERIHESPTLFTLRLRFTDPTLQEQFQFEAGQFNMVYLYGVGEIPISIVSDPKDSHIIDHTIRIVGRVTQGLANLKAGDHVGIRGPYGRGWPLQQAEQDDVIIITGGLGCAPVVSVINYVANRRERFGHLNIVQGVKHSDDFIWRERYDQWRELPDTTVLLAADEGTPLWPWHIGLVTDLFDNLVYDPNHVNVMMCGPEGMMRVVTKNMLAAGVGPCNIWLSMERNMQCAVGHCGHCQYGKHFICKNGPVFCYEQVADLFGIRGF